MCYRKFMFFISASAGWYFFCIIVGIVLGIFLAFVVPRVIRRFRLRNARSGYGTMHEDAQIAKLWNLYLKIAIILNGKLKKRLGKINSYFRPRIPPSFIVTLVKRQLLIVEYIACFRDLRVLQNLYFSIFAVHFYGKTSSVGQICNIKLVFFKPFYHFAVCNTQSQCVFLVFS